MLAMAGLIIKDLDFLGLGHYSESSLKKRQLKELEKIRNQYIDGTITKREYKMLAKDVLNM